MFFDHLKSDFILLSDPYKIRQIHSNLEFVKMQFSVKSIVFMTERKKIHQNFLASKYDVNQPSEAT